MAPSTRTSAPRASGPPLLRSSIKIRPKNKVKVEDSEEDDQENGEQGEQEGKERDEREGKKPRHVAPTTTAGSGFGIPRWLRFPLLVVSSLALSAVGYTALSSSDLQWFRGGVGGWGELVGVSRPLGEWWEVAAIVGWKGFELGLGWFGDYDSYDIAALGLLARGPTAYLLFNFYAISAPTILSSLLIDSLATYIPFRLLRHSPSRKLKVPNNEIASDASIGFLSTALAAAIYSVTLFTAYRTFLPSVLVTAFAGIKSVEAVHKTEWVTLLPLMAGFGGAIRGFVFVPAAVVDRLNASFNPVTATLYETFIYNIWGYSTRTKTVIKRTATLMFVSGVRTFLHTWVALEGVEARGAAVYSGVWVFMAGISGAVMGLVGAV